MDIRILILEDNPITAKDLSEVLKENGFEHVQVYHSAEEALIEIDSFRPDVLLVDIKLKKDGLSGIDFIKKMQSDHSFPFIFISANSNRDTLNEALDTRPAAFLTKPFDEKDVVIAVELAFKNHFMTALQSQDEDEEVFLKFGKKYEKVLQSEILYLEADGSYCKITTENKVFTVTGNLQSFCDQLNSDNFIRIHRSYIVNIKSIMGLDNEHVFLKKRALPIGRSYKEEVKTHFKKYV